MTGRLFGVTGLYRWLPAGPYSAMPDPNTAMYTRIYARLPSASHDAKTTDSSVQRFIPPSRTVQELEAITLQLSVNMRLPRYRSSVLRYQVAQKVETLGRGKRQPILDYRA